MGDKSKIEWTDATWNPIRGCSRVSEGCRNCYAESVAARLSNPGQAYEGLATMTTSGPRWTGKVQMVPEHLEDPIRWKRPRRIFVNSMSDLFHPNVTITQMTDIFEVMAKAPQHVFQVLTKRPDLMMQYVNAEIGVGVAYRLGKQKEPGFWPLKNVWLGVSVEDQRTAEERIPLLLRTTAAKRFISAEPLLGPINLYNIFGGERSILSCESYCSNDGCGWPACIGNELHWCIVGGESGHGARPMHPQWARELRDQCRESGIQFFFKQWGEFEPSHLLDTGIVAVHGKGIGHQAVMKRVGKKAAGRLLDGVEHNEMPAVA